MNSDDVLEDADIKDAAEAAMLAAEATVNEPSASESARQYAAKLVKLTPEELVDKLRATEDAHKLVGALTEERPELGLVNAVGSGVTIDGKRIVAVSSSLYHDLQATARSSGGSTDLGAMLTDIASRAVDEKSGQIGPALESTVDLVINDKPSPAARVLIEKVAPDAAIVRYHPSQ